MFMLFFACYDPQGDYHECSCGDLSLEGCLDRLSTFASSGWRLVWINVSEGQKMGMFLPVEAFDGQPMAGHLRELQRTWEEILLIT